MASDTPEGSEDLMLSFLPAAASLLVIVTSFLLPSR